MTEAQLNTGREAPPRPGQIRKIVAAAYVGTALEWYDFLLFGTTAALVFGPLFFPGSDPTLSTISAFLSFAAGFVGRPLGAFIFGHIGDRFGRRIALILSMLLMGTASTLIGVLPTHAAAGIAAPILLTVLRALQGVAVGGEWGGATLLAIEYAAPRRRGFYASLVQMGLPTGTLLSSGAVALTTLLPREDFLAWGWRLPYLVSAVLVAVGLWLRWHIEETPVFRALATEKKIENAPILETFKSPAKLVLGVAVYLFTTAGFYVMTTFMISYATHARGLPPSVILNALTIGAVGQFIGLAFAGRLAERIGSARTVILGHVFCVLLSYPIFLAVDSGRVALITLVVIATLSLITIAIGPIGELLSQLFPVRLQYSGIALSVGIAGVIAGFMPALAAWISAASGDASWGPASLAAGLALISLVSAITAKRIISSERPKFVRGDSTPDTVPQPHQ